MIFLSTFLLSIFVTMALIPALTRLAGRLHALDVPDWRKVHNQPIPRTGGLAMAIGTLVSVGVWFRADSFLIAYLIGAYIIVLLGLVDDIKGLDYRAKFTGQIVAALVLILVGGIKIKTLGTLLPESALIPEWCSIPLTLLVIVGVTNAVNLADGLDGLAGGICLLSLGCLGYLAYLEDDFNIVLLAISLSGAIFGFLRFNTYPATVFMGDTGSQLMGYSVIALALNLTQGQTPLSPIVPLLIIGFPILDTATVMVERLVHRRPLFAADKNHLHHKLMGLGLFHTEAVLAIYVAQTVFVVAAVVLRFHSDWTILSAYLLLSGVLLGGLIIAERKKWQLHREGRFDRLIKGRLRELRERKVFIRASYGSVKLGLPLLLVVTCLLPGAVPGYLGVLCALAGVAVVVGHLLGKTWGKRVLLTTLYLFIPFIVFFSEADKGAWLGNIWLKVYNASYGLLLFLVLLTLKWTRRREGFRMTPMDFLILFIAFAVSLLPAYYTAEYHLGPVAVKIVTLFFAYEVLIGELRGELGPVTWSTVAALFVTAARGLLGF
jgi:UDP-GlcNAc:undecaprenyl-phosphate/decaprenyl-phosphate GlcNAc-1-phosphate transferase